MRGLWVAKIKRSNLNKVNLHRSKVPGERVYIDTSSVNTQSFNGSKFWIIAVDDATKFKWSMFVQTKNNIGEAVASLIKSNEKLLTKLRFLRMDNAGENLCVGKVLRNAGIKNIQYEYTAPYTPQQNGVAERGFSGLYPEYGLHCVAWMRSLDLGPASGLSAPRR